MNVFELVNQLAVLLAARNPEWVSQAAYTGAPEDVAGAQLNNAPFTRAIIDLREEVHTRTSRVSISTLDLTATYTVTIDGNAIAYDAGAGGAADAEDVLEGIANALNADGTVGGLITAVASDEDGDGTKEVVKITGDAEADYSIDISATGSGVLACAADASSAKARLYLTARGQGSLPTGWRMPPGGELGAITWRGYDERFGTAGHGRAYIELYDIAGHASDGSSVTYSPEVWIGPGVQE